ncbi:MAG: SGNH/GDSL hydrolase family protein [Erysipelotrichaceae bacterium]
MKRRSIFTLLLSFLLLVAFPLSASAGKPITPPTPLEYVGIGDSIGYGMSATPGNDYYTKFSGYLASRALAQNKPFVSFNTASPGLTSSQLDDEVAGRTTTTLTHAKLPGANVVTISIGGNNLMHPLLDYVAALYGVSTDDPNFMNVMAAAVNANPGVLSNAMLWQILLPGTELKNAFAAGVADFKADLPTLISGIKALAPLTKIYFLSVNNPLYGNDQFRSFLDGYIVQINNELKARASAYGYTVVDVYTAFNANTGSQPLVGFDMSANPATYDPHPTDAGHKLIYDLLVAAYAQPVKGRK